MSDPLFFRLNAPPCSQVLSPLLLCRPRPCAIVFELFGNEVRITCTPPMDFSPTRLFGTFLLSIASTAPVYVRRTLAFVLLSLDEFFVLLAAVLSTTLVHFPRMGLPGAPFLSLSSGRCFSASVSAFFFSPTGWSLLCPLLRRAFFTLAHGPAFLFKPHPLPVFPIPRPLALVME